MCVWFVNCFTCSFCKSIIAFLTQECLICYFACKHTNRAFQIHYLYPLALKWSGFLLQRTGQPVAVYDVNLNCLVLTKTIFSIQTTKINAFCLDFKQHRLDANLRAIFSFGLKFYFLNRRSLKLNIWYCLSGKTWYFEI